MEPTQAEVMPNPTFGQKAVGINFNPGGDDKVNRIKQILANAIDEMHAFRQTSKSTDAQRLASIAITELQGAQMWCVKAITWRD